MGQSREGFTILLLATLKKIERNYRFRFDNAVVGFIIIPIPLVDCTCCKVCSLYAGFCSRINVFDDELVKWCRTGNAVVEHTVREIVVKMVTLKAVHRFVHTDVNTSFDRVLVGNTGYEGSGEIIIDDLLLIPQPAVHLILPEHRVGNVKITIGYAL